MLINVQLLASQARNYLEEHNFKTIKSAVNFTAVLSVLYFYEAYLRVPTLHYYLHRKHLLCLPAIALRL